MNTKLIPTLLAVTILVAGAFAFAPIDQASTIHTSGTITTAGGVTLDSAEDLTARVVAGDNAEITITIGTDDDTPFVIQQVLACGDTDDDVAGDLEPVSVTIDGDIIDRDEDGIAFIGTSIADGDDVQACSDILRLMDKNLNGELGLIWASDGGEIVITLNGAISGDTLTSVKVFGLVQSGANLTVVSALSVE